MIVATITDPGVLALLPACFSNRQTNCASQGQRRRLNADKQAFIDAVCLRTSHDWSHEVLPSGRRWCCRLCGASSTRLQPPGSACPRGKILRLGCAAEGRQIVGDAALLFELRLARCDIDAPLKAVQDALQGVLLYDFSDRVVKVSAQVLTRPKKGTKKRPAVPAMVRVTAWSTEDLEGFWTAAKAVARWA